MRFFSLLLLLFLAAHLQAAPSVPSAVSFRFDSVPVRLVAAVVFSDLLKRPYVIDDAIKDTRVTLELSDVPLSSVPGVLDVLLRNSGVHVQEHHGVVFLLPAPASEVVYYVPRHRSAADLLQALRLAFPHVPLSSGVQVEPSSNQTSASQRRFDAAISSSSGQDAPVPLVAGAGLPPPVGLDVVVLTLPPRDAAIARDLLAVLDQPSEQLYIRAIAYDVRLTQDQGTSLDLALSLFSQKLGVSVGAGGLIQNAGAVLSFSNATIDAVAKILDQDSRFSAISRPSVRVRSGGSARFSVGQEVPTLGAVTSNNSGTQQSIVYRQSGIVFDVRPVIRSQMVDIDLIQSISSFQRTTSSNLDSPTLTKRELISTLSVRPGDVVVIAGLDSQDDEGQSSGLFGLPIGKSTKHSKTQTLLVLEVQRI